MNDYHAEMNLPKPVVPSLPTLTLLKGQTALVTGANSGIGRAIAISLGKAGANVVVNYVTKPEDAEAVALEIRSGGQRALTAQADVGDEAQVQAMFAAAVRELGTVDILVSNAGMERNAPFHEMTTTQWDAVINVNLRGAFLCSREAVREFLRRGVRPEVSVAAGKIIFISSVHDVIPWAGHVNYAASKGGLMLLMKSLAQEVAEKRIRVNSIAPGAIAYADQYGSVGDTGGLRGSHEAGALQTYWRGGRNRSRCGMACLGFYRLHRRNDALYRWRDDIVPGVRGRRLASSRLLSVLPGAIGPAGDAR